MVTSHSSGHRAGKWVAALLLGVSALAFSARAPQAAGTAVTILINPQPNISVGGGLVTNYDIAVDSGTVRMRGYTRVMGDTLQGVQITVDGTNQPTLTPVPAVGGEWLAVLTGLSSATHTVSARGVLSDSSVEAITTENTATFDIRNDTASQPAAAYEIAPTPPLSGTALRRKISIPGPNPTGATFSNSLSVTLGIDALADGMDEVNGIEVTNANPITDAALDVPTIFPVSPSQHSVVGLNLSWTLAAGVDGQREVLLRARDTGGAFSVYYKRTIVLDTSAPTGVIATPLANSYQGSKTFTVTGTVADVLAGVVSPMTLLIQPLDSGGNPTGSPTSYSVPLGTDGTFSQSVTVPTDGRYRATIQPVDNAGNTGSASQDFRVASTPPTVVIEQPTGTYVEASFPIQVRVTDPNYGTTVISVDGNPTPTMTGNGPGPDDHTVVANGPLTEGPHHISVTSTGLGGASTTVTKDVIEDNNPPDGVITAPIGGSKVPYSSLSVQGTVTDTVQLASWTLSLQNIGLGTAPVTVASSSVSGTSAPVSATIPATRFQDSSGNPNVGPYQLVLDVTDASGKTDPSPATVTFTVDTPPVPVITSPTDGEVRSGVLVVRGTVSDDTALTQWDLYLDGSRIATGLATGTATDISVPIDTRTLSAGSHTLLLTATDSLGQVGTDTATFIVDNTAPSINFTAPADHALVTNPVTFTATINDANPVTWTLLIDGVQVDSGSGSSVSSTQTLTNGTHQVELRASDNAATFPNTSSVTRTITVGNATGPTVVISAPTNNKLVRGTIHIEAQLTDANDLDRWELTEGATLIASSDVTGNSVHVSYPLDTTTLSDGTHTLTLTAYDDFGFSSGSSVTIRVDNSAPEVDIAVGPSNQLRVNRNAKITLTFNDAANFDGIDISYISIRVHKGGVPGKSSSLGKIIRLFAFGGLVDPESGNHLERFVSPGTRGQITLPLRSKQFPAGNYTVEVIGVRDAAGNLMAPTTFTFHVSR